MFALVFSTYLLIAGAGEPQKGLDIAYSRHFTSRAACEERGLDVDKPAKVVLGILGDNKLKSTIARIEATCSAVGVEG